MQIGTRDFSLCYFDLSPSCVRGFGDIVLDIFVKSLEALNPGFQTTLLGTEDRPCSLL